MRALFRIAELQSMIASPIQAARRLRGRLELGKCHDRERTKEQVGRCKHSTAYLDHNGLAQGRDRGTW
jgi:hypothetical protein